ncbi:MAG: FAD-binding oxidoreductase [Candidatus Jordarchaeales archaeon]
MLQSMLSREEIYRFLAGVVGEDDVSVEIADLYAYSMDASMRMSMPAAVARPESREEVAEILRWANENRVPIVPRGAGTSLSGQAVPVKGGVVLDMCKMDKIKEIDLEDRVAVVEPGVIYDELNRELGKLGYVFPPDPGSAIACTVGGMVANNASGIRALKYGATVDHVLGLEVVLPGGRIIRTGGRVWKSSSGLNLTKLFVGSEGALGVFTEVILKITPKPRYYGLTIPVFQKLEQALEATVEIMRRGILPSAMELLDDICIMIINNVLEEKLPNGEALLFIENDGYSEGTVEEESRMVKKICEEKGAQKVIYTTDAERIEELMRLRHTLANMLAKLRGENIPLNNIQDFAVPIGRIPEAVRELKATAQSQGRLMVIFGHIGDGNIHLGTAINPWKEEDRRAGAEFARRLAEIVVKKYGGTLSAEHGLGVTKASLVELEHGDTIKYMRAIKKVFDPHGIMNPGVMGLIEVPRDEFVYMPTRVVA